MKAGPALRGDLAPQLQAFSFEDSGFCAYFQILAPLINAWPPGVDCSGAGFE